MESEPHPHPSVTQVLGGFFFDVYGISLSADELIELRQNLGLSEDDFAILTDALAGEPSANMPPNLDHFTKVAHAAENAVSKYSLVTVQTMCYEAWTSCSIIAARAENV